MKKRILAIVLACLMLVSVLPTSAFAVEHNHNLDTGLCPGADAGTDGHNKTNCDWGEGPLFTVAPMCGELGYSVYECQGCKTHFIADTTYGEGGSHEYGELIAAVAPNCAEKKDGTVAHYQCATCEKYFNEQKQQITSIVDPWEHTWIPNSGDDVDCTKDSMVCAVCGATKAVEGDHVWGKVEIDTYPTVNTTGRAVEKCTNEGCTVSRYILIEKQCIHPADSLTKVEAKNPTCDEGGWIEHYTCSECTAANGGKTVYLLATPGYIPQYYVVTKGMVTQDKLGHDFGENEIVTVAPKCYADNTMEDGCTYQHCNRCDKDIILSTIEAKHQLEQYDITEPECEKYGAKHLLCRVCGYVTQEAIEPLDHLGFDKGTNKSITNPTCATPGKREWTCGRVVEDYDADGNRIYTSVCTEKFEEEIRTVKHNFVNLEISNTCVKGGWAMSFCTYDDCSLPLATETATGESIADLIAQYNEANPNANITIPAEGVHLENFQAYAKYDCGHSQFGHDESCRLKHRWKQYGLNEPTCFEEGSIAWICLDCNASWHEKIEKLEHNFTIPVSDTPSTCVQAGSKVMQCSNPGCTEQQVTEYDAISQDEINNIYNWLDKNGDRVADPTLTGKPYIQQVHTNLVDFVDANIVVEDLENFNANDPAVRDGKYHQMIKGNCETVGIYFIWCDDCGRGLYVTDGFTGNEPHQIDKTTSDYVPQKDATCFESGWTEKGHCSVCGYVMAGELIPALHNDPNAVELVPAVTPVCGGIGVKQHWRCDCMGYEKYYLTDEPTSEADVLTPEQHAALHFTQEHNWSEHCFGNQNCTEFAYVHFVCLNEGCKYGATKDYYGVQTNGDPTSSNFFNLEDGRALGHNMQEATCEQNAFCARPGCGLVIEGTALGHVNKDGQTLTTDCSDPAQREITDRNCVNCKEGCEHWDYEKMVGVIDFVHDEYDVIREGNCVEYACEITMCKKCLEQLKYYQGEKGDHDFRPVEGVASYVSEALERCIHCGEERYNAWTGFQVFLNAENANGSGFKYVDSSLIKVGISVASIKQVGIHTLVYEMTYDARNFYFEGSSMYDENGNLTLPEGFAGGDIWNRVVDGVGYVRIVLVADNNSEDGSYENFIIPALDENGKGLNLVDVYLRAWLEEDVRALWENPMVKTKFAHLSAFATYEVSAVNVEGKAVDCAGSDVEVDIYPLLDTDNTWTFEPTDIWYAYMILDKAVKENGEAFEYHVAADVDKDGKITMTDLYYIYKYATHEIDYETLRSVGV